MGLDWDSYANLMFFFWDSNGIPRGFDWDSYGNLMEFDEILLGFQWDLIGVDYKNRSNNGSEMAVSPCK